MNGLLYCLVVVIWGTTWIAIYLQQGPVAAPVSIFWRFAIASTVMIAILLISGKLRKLSGRDHLFCLLQGGCVFALTSGVFTLPLRGSIPVSNPSFSRWRSCSMRLIATCFLVKNHQTLLCCRRAGADRYRHLVLAGFGQQRVESLAAAGDWFKRPRHFWFLTGQYDKSASSEKKVSR